MFSPEKHVITADDDGNGEYYISVDYGTNNPTSMGLWKKAGSSATRVCEYYYDSKKTMRQLTDEEYYGALCNLAGERKIKFVIVDPSAASFITTIRRHGKFMVKKADNRVLDGIRFCSTLLSSQRLKFDASCKDIIREFGAYRWDDEAREDAVIKKNDHAMDEMRYFCQTVMRKER